ncbi:hypothetical protein OYC64_001439 [Pagothenia borchgrevinki]|uniref:Neurotransmitter-gated ion-channel ligand-binding domain-containing protein n=1 Tax=Pagothenia borchgrevinki TaxID=8213 RepID=A0ABD2GBE1_PAGBO
MFTGFLFLLILPGGSTNNNSKDDNNKGGSSWNTTELRELQDDLTSNHSFEASGETFNNSEQQELNGQLSDKDKGNNDSKKSCRNHDILNYLNLTQNKEWYSMVRPGDPLNYTEVFLYLSLRGILDVREIDQTLVSSIRMYMKWRDPDIHWDPGEFCGIRDVTVPADLLWKPDVMIEEM